ncbi:hypothetical protein BRADI_1g70215v3 [Brachypodium distachyon]|uniref:Uncharacterized protein n=1 Tax=Brachypodium distachyon TaxID=15368 RepID=A0A0Q3SD73_BRADI|nr:hypothetical protein BRADI_1g70215v3 [Brachypodium distachyon]
MFPVDEPWRVPDGRSGATDRHDGLQHPLPVVAAGRRSTLYDSFELNAMVGRLNRLLQGDGAGRRPAAPRSLAGTGSWLAAPKVLFRKIKRAFLGGARPAAGS